MGGGEGGARRVAMQQAGGAGRERGAPLAEGGQGGQGGGIASQESRRRGRAESAFD